VKKAPILLVFHTYKPTLKIPPLYVRRGRLLSMVVCMTDMELMHMNAITVLADIRSNIRIERTGGCFKRNF